MRSRTLLVIGLAMLLAAGLLGSWAAFSSGSSTSSTVITTNGQTITVKGATAKPGKQTVTVNGHAATVRVPFGVPGPSNVRTVRAPGTTVKSPARTVTETKTVTHATTVAGATHTVTQVVAQVQTQTIRETATQTVAGPTQVQTVTVNPSGKCPPPKC